MSDSITMYEVSTLPYSSSRESQLFHKRQEAVSLAQSWIADSNVLTVSIKPVVFNRVPEMAKK